MATQFEVQAKFGYEPPDYALKGINVATFYEVHLWKGVITCEVTQCMA